jgi:hypothetical protein
MIGLLFAGAAAGLQSFAASQEAKAKSNTYGVQASYYQRQADFELIKADYDTARLRERTDRTVAKQQNIYMGAGFTLEGSPTDVAWDTFTESEKDAYAINLGAKIRSQNYQAEAANALQLQSSAETAGAIGQIAPFVKLGMSMFPMK